MIGPRASPPRYDDVDDLPELSRRARLAFGANISSVDMAITWQRGTSAQVASRRRGALSHQDCSSYAGTGLFAASCASHDEMVAGTKQTRPKRINWSAPLSGPREPYGQSAAKKASTPTSNILTTGRIRWMWQSISSTAAIIRVGRTPNRYLYGSVLPNTMKSD